MKIELDDQLMAKVGLTEQQCRELLVLAIYTHTGIHTTLAGKLLDTGIEGFHEVMAKYQWEHNYSTENWKVDLDNIEKERRESDEQDRSK